MLGSAIVTTRFSGPPTFLTASLIISTVFIEVLLAPGCGANTIEFPADIIPIELHIIVSLGLVDGVIAPITPYGESSITVSPSSPLKAKAFKSSTPGVFSIVT